MDFQDQGNVWDPAVFAGDDPAKTLALGQKLLTDPDKMLAQADAAGLPPPGGIPLPRPRPPEAPSVAQAMGEPMDIQAPAQKQGPQPGVAERLLATLKNVKMPADPTPQKISSPAAPRPQAIPAQSNYQNLLATLMGGGAKRQLPSTLGSAIR